MEQKLLHFNHLHFNTRSRACVFLQAFVIANFVARIVPE